MEAAGLKRGETCLACVLGEIEVEPYRDPTGVDVDCSLCWDTGIIRDYGSAGSFSFPTKFGSNSQITEGLAQSFAFSGGAPAVLIDPVQAAYRKSARVNSATSPETWVADGRANTLNTFENSDVRTTHLVIGYPPEEDDRLPNGIDNARWKCCGNGVVANVAEFIGRRLVAVDRKWTGGAK
jgi:hypothetical protein